jgi:hypothetical protein
LCGLKAEFCRQYCVNVVGGEFTNVAANWLRYLFKGDKKAGKMFVGEDCGFCTNPNWDTDSKRLD